MVGLQHASMAIFNAYIDRVPMIVLGGTGPMNYQAAPPAHRLDSHRAGPRQSGARLHQMGRSTLLSRRRAGFFHPRLPHCYDGSDRAGLYQLRCRIQEDAIKSDVDIPDVNRYSAPAPTQANPEALRKAAELLVNAQAPLIIADSLGRNPKSVPALIGLAELLAVPVVDKGATL